MKKKYFIIASIVVLVVIAAIVALIFFLQKPKTTPTAPDETNNESEHLAPQPLPSPATQGIYNILLMGTGDVGHPGGGLTDSINVLHLDTVQKKATLIFLPRDLWVNNSDGSSRMKINEAYFKGGFAEAKKVASGITNLPIQYAIAVDFNGFAQIIDGLGGVEITIEKAFDDYFYPIKGKELELCGMSNEEIARVNQTMSGFELEKQFTCRYEHLHFDAGTTKVDGATALKFTRSRHSAQDGSDYARGARQQIVLVGIKNKLISLEALKSVDKWFNKFIKLVKTDLDLDSAKAIAGYIANPESYQVSNVVPSESNILKAGKSTSGQFILIPKAGDNNWSELQDLIKKQI
jgi:polyisoprenyl-teichoic acid--peptidoglycan teichoic acid transferase